VRQGECSRLVGGTPTRAVETTALPIFKCIVPTKCVLRSEVTEFAPPMRPKKRNSSSASVQFEKHRPERRRVVGGYLFCNGRCCCCCCCLHTYGGLIGATAVTLKMKSATGGSVAGCYWTYLTILAGAICIVPSGCIVASDSSVVTGLVAALLFLPLAQLVASIVTLIWVQTRSVDFPDKKASLQTLGRITVWSILGALAGMLAMLLGFKMFQ